MILFVDAGEAFEILDEDFMERVGEIVSEIQGE
jgi:hypothetical protein